MVLNYCFEICLANISKLLLYSLECALQYAEGMPLTSLNYIHPLAT